MVFPFGASLRVRLSKFKAAGVAKLFAHIGLKAVDDLAEERHGQAYSDYKAGAIALPESETQVQMLLTRYCLATRLNLARYLPSVISQPALSIVDDLLVATVAGCPDESPTNLTAATQGRALLAMRYGGVLPGAATTAPARSRRLSAQSVKSGLRWSGGAPNQMRFGWCGSVSELVKLTPH